MTSETYTKSDTEAEISRFTQLLNHDLRLSTMDLEDFCPRQASRRNRRHDSPYYASTLVEARLPRTHPQRPRTACSQRFSSQNLTDLCLLSLLEYICRDIHGAAAHIIPG